FVLKRFDPWLARRNELVLRRWLPALGLEERAPRLLATAAERHGGCVWHVYEDLGEGALDPAHPDPERVGVVVALIAELHTRAAGHALVPECRHFCGNLGAPFFAANLADAIALLERLAPPRVEPTPEQGALRGRLLTRLYRLRDDLPRRVHLLETVEYARYANRIIWPAVALLEQRAAWGFEQLAEVERWFDALELALPD